MDSEGSLSSLRKHQKNKEIWPWLKSHLPWLFSFKSLFWLFVFVFLLGICWMGYSLINNYGTQMYGWDYEIQYVQFEYTYWDMWHSFFKTGHFPLYDTRTFFGTDNIGSNSYYGLFDPFMFLCMFFPRSWIPQEFAIITCIKGAVGAMAMRAYLKYMGVSEKSSRVGAVAFAFCGYLNFMVGFPSFVSVCAFTPLILLGIEKVIKERKITCLIFSIALIGMVSFFFLVVFCVFGVCYALWRYFWTIKSRNANQNWAAIGLGVLSFALGIAMVAWTLLPSLRESALSGRTVSIGKAYLTSIINAFKNQDFGTLFGRLFEMVGDNPGRELMGLVTFFFPTTNYYSLPIYAGSGYDSWTASLFCYTPMVIFFIFEFINIIREKDWEHIIALPICLYLVFTTFAYFFFYAFTGDGYGRWFIVLVPLIIRQACRGIDHIKDAPQWQLTNSCLLTVLFTVLTYFVTYYVLKGKTFDVINGYNYWISSYNVPAKVTWSTIEFFQDLRWIVIYQIALTIIEGVVVVFFAHKEYFQRILIGFIAFETIVCGNCSFIYGSSYSYGLYFNGGYDSSVSWTVANDLQQAVDNTNSIDDGYYRSYVDYPYDVNLANGMGYNGNSTFHSLFNSGVDDMARYSHILENESKDTSFDGAEIVHTSWAGSYSNKRAAFDIAMGYKYYYIVYEDTSDFGGKNEGGVWANDSYLYNVPFGSELVYKNSKYAVYENPYYISLGHSVDSYFRANEATDSDYLNYNDFYRNRTGTDGWREIFRNEQVYLNGAIFDDDAEVDSSFAISEAPSLYSLGNFVNLSSKVQGYIYTYTVPDAYNIEDPGAFLNDVSSDTLTITGPFTPNGFHGYPGIYTGGEADGTYGKMVWKCNTDSGYFNDDPSGAYFLFADDSSSETRIYMIGDYTDSDGTVHTNVQLNYEYHAIHHNQQENGSSLSRVGLYGIYAPGKVKAIVFQRKENTRGMDFSPYILMQSKTDFDAQYKKLSDGALTDVSYSADKFTFSSNYDKKEIVVTSLGYDAGWQAKATYKGASGENISEDCKMYRLDGGFVGFEAPAGEVSYTLTYNTPYLNAGVGITIAALVVYFGYEISIFVYGYKRLKRHRGLEDWKFIAPVTGAKPDDDKEKEDD